MRRAAFLFLLSFGTILSQNDPVQELDEIVLHGNFSPQLNSGYSLRVLPDSLLSSQFQSLGALLRKQENLYFRQNGFGMVSSLSLRGSSASQTGVYWNGIPINSALNGQTDFNALQAVSFSQVEVRRGGGSVLLGSGAVGGAINLADQVVFDEQLKGSVLMEAGSFDTYSLQFSGIWSKDDWYGKVALGGMNSVNDYDYPGTLLYNENGEISNRNLSAVFGHRINEEHMLAVHTSFFDNDRNLPRTLSVSSKARLSSLDSRVLGEWKYFGQRFSSSLKMAYLHEEYRYWSNREQPEAHSDGNSDRVLAKYDLTYYLHATMFIRSGIELEQASGNGSNIVDAERTDLTAYTLFHHEPLENLVYNASLRAGSSSAYSIPLIYSLDAKWTLSKVLGIRGAVSSNYRLPTFNDLYWQPGGNPDLLPESSFSAEGGLVLDTPTWKAGITGFYIQSKDLIVWQPSSPDFWQPQNVKQASNKGLELSLENSWTYGRHRTGLQVFYDLTRAEDDDSGNQLIYVPEHRASARVDHQWKRWQFQYYLQYTGEVYITTSNTQVLDDYWLSDIEASRSFLKNRMRLLLQVNNLFDQNYQSVAYRPMPGRNYACTIKYNF